MFGLLIGDRLSQSALSKLSRHGSAKSHKSVVLSVGENSEKGLLDEDEDKTKDKRNCCFRLISG